MALVYPHPEFEDIVYSYLVALYKRFGRPMNPITIAMYLSDDVGEKVKAKDVGDALRDLEQKGLILGFNEKFRPKGLSEDLRVQLALQEVEPFTREYGETPEAHIDKVWDFREELVKPEVGGKYGLPPLIQYSYMEKPWEGLIQDD